MQKSNYVFNNNKKTYFFPFIVLTDNWIRETGATSLSEALKSNTTLTELDLNCEYRRKKTNKRHSSTIHSFLFSTQTGNLIGDIGMTSLSEALKSNTALTELSLCCEDKRKKKHK